MKPLPFVVEEGRMTEAEARVVGASANRIVNLRGLLASRSPAQSGSLTIQTPSGAVAVYLLPEDTSACLALLIEREAALLTGFNVVLESHPSHE